MREKYTHALLLGFDVCFSTQLRLSLPSIFQCCIFCSECCYLLCVGLHVQFFFVFFVFFVFFGGGGGGGGGKLHVLYVSYNECVPAVLLKV